jgi:hypothetical protein
MDIDEIDPLIGLIKTIPRIRIPNNTELELECRFSIDERKAEKAKIRRLNPSETTRLVKNIITDHISKKTPCFIEQSINFIKNNTNIKQLIFINGIQKKNLLKHYKKERLINTLIVLDNPSYKISLSFEHKLPEFNILECQSARIKLRFSIVLEPWRLDITLIRKVNTLSNPKLLKDNKTKMLYELSVNDFVKNAPWEYAHHIEFETEYIGTLKNLSIIDFDISSNLVKKYIESLDYSKLISIDEFNIVNIDDMKNKRIISEEYQNKLYEVALFIKPNKAGLFKSRFGIKQLSNQVIEMDKNIFLSQVYGNITDYYITDKVDGNRAIVLINEHGSWAITNELKSIGYVNKTTTTYIFDCEEYKEEYYIFDIMVWENKSIIDQPFEERLKLFDNAIKISSDVKELTIKKKPFIRLTKSFQSEIKNLKTQHKEYETDGFVFTPYNGLYNNMQVYKYKPIDKLSVDFLIKKCPQKLLGIKPYLAGDKSLYLLFCGISKKVYNKLDMKLLKQYDKMFPNINQYYLPDYFPIQFEPSDVRFAYLYWSNDTDLDNQIGEFVISNPKSIASKYHWKLLRIRIDRQVELQRGNYFGNNYKVAEMTWLSYQNPLIIEEMKLSTNDIYFQKNESDIHKASRNYNSFVKSQIFNQYRDVHNVLDMASGKGQDLFRYSSAGIGKVLFTEIDKTALMELNSRKHDFSKGKKGNKMRILTQQLDLNNSYLENIHQIDDSMIEIPNNGFDLIICNFAFHYLVSTRTSLINVGKFINKYIKEGGRFIFTSFDGQAIVDLLKEHNGNYESTIPGKFNIIKDYNGDIIQPIGQKIKVLLPFSNDEHYTEYLINIDYIEGEFAKLGMVLETNESFSKYIDNYKHINSQGYNSMDSDDKLYTSLYHYYGFYKPKNNK